MGITAEWIVAIFRHGENHQKFGDDFSLSFTVVREGESVTIKGASGSGVNKALIVELKSYFKSIGVKRILWVRARGKSVVVNVD